MSVSKKNESIPDARLEKMLMSLRDDHSVPEKPPVVNTFRLEMEAERRRSRIQLEIVTVAAFVSVTATLFFTAVFFRFMLPDLIAHSDRRTREMIFEVKAAAEAVFRQFGVLILAITLIVLLRYVFSAVLLITKRNVLFAKKE